MTSRADAIAAAVDAYILMVRKAAAAWDALRKLSREAWEQPPGLRRDSIEVCGGDLDALFAATSGLHLGDGDRGSQHPAQEPGA